MLLVQLQCWSGCRWCSFVARPTRDIELAALPDIDEQLAALALHDADDLEFKDLIDDQMTFRSILLFGSASSLELRLRVRCRHSSGGSTSNYLATLEASADLRHRSKAMVNVTGLSFKTRCQRQRFTIV
jgi:hypothetical protein